MQKVLSFQDDVKTENGDQNQIDPSLRLQNCSLLKGLKNLTDDNLSKNVTDIQTI